MKVFGHRRDLQPFPGRDTTTATQYRSRSPGVEEMEAAKTEGKSLAVEETPLSDSNIL